MCINFDFFQVGIRTPYILLEWSFSYAIISWMVSTGLVYYFLSYRVAQHWIWFESQSDPHQHEKRETFFLPCLKAQVFICAAVSAPARGRTLLPSRMSPTSLSLDSYGTRNGQFEFSLSEFQIARWKTSDLTSEPSDVDFFIFTLYECFFTTGDLIKF
jgi:hypothetical protein